MARQLQRSTEDRIVGGVCGGIGDYFGVETILVRLVWVVLTFFGVGTGVLLYTLAWLIIPDELGNRSSTALVLVIILFLLLPLCSCCGLTGAIFTDSSGF